MPAMSALTNVDRLFAMFKLFSIITSVAEIIAYNDAYRDDRLDEALKYVIAYNKAHNDDKID